MDGMERALPLAEEAERAVLGALILEPWETVAKVRRFGLKEESFFDPRHQLLFSIILKMAEDGRAVDAITVFNHLKVSGQLEKIGGQEYLIDLQNPALVCGHVEEYADSVRQAWIKRAMLEKLRVIEADVYASERGDKVLKSAPEHLMSIVDEALREKKLSDHVDEMMVLFERAAKGEKLYGLPLPWDGLNEVMCGMPKGLGFIAARPSMGKTTVEDVLSIFWASMGIPGARITQDMTTIRLLQRAASRMAGVSLPKIKKGFVKFGSLQWTMLEEAAAKMKEFPLFINDSDPNIHQLCTWIRMLKIKYDIQFVTLDYIQQFETGTRLDQDENGTLKFVSRKLKSLANELDISIIALSQLNRGNTKEGRKPMMSDMRGSGTLEQDAQWVWLLYKDSDRFSLAKIDEACPESKTLRPVWIDVAKQQDGETAALPFWMYPNYFRLEPAAESFSESGEWYPFSDLKEKQEQQTVSKRAEANDEIDVEFQPEQEDFI